MGLGHEIHTACYGKPQRGISRGRYRQAKRSRVGKLQEAPKDSEDDFDIHMTTFCSQLSVKT